MEEDNKVWLGLGEDQIDQSLFLTNAANNIQSYVQSKPWSTKRKQSFLNAYNAIMQTGVTGATNDTGQWELTTQTQLDPSGLSNRDQEMLGDAAYFILSQMQDVTPRGTVESTEEPKEKTKFVGATAFDNWVSNNVFGGRQYSRAQDWNILDERDKTTGKRGVANRLSRMKDYLTQFRNTLNDNDWDYTDNPTGKNAAEVQARLDRAIASLTGKTEVDQDIIDSLNALGINYRDWFDNGLGEDSGKKDANGNPLTWQQWQEQQTEDAKLKAEADAAKLKAQNEAIKASPWGVYGIKTFNKNASGWSDRDIADKIGTSSENIVTALNNLSGRLDSLSSDEESMLLGIFKSKNIPKQQISKDVYDILKRSKRFAGQPISRFSQIPGVDGIVLDNVTGQLIYPKNGGVTQNGNWLEGQSTQELDDKKRIQAGNRKPSEDFEFEDFARMGAAAADITSIVASFVPGYGTAVAGAGGLASLGANLAADWTDDSVTAGQMIKNIGVNTGLAIVGLVPGLGAATKTGRVLATIAKWIPRIVALGAAGQVAISPEIHKSLEKVISDPKNLTVNDWKNIGYALSATAGLARGARGIADYRKYNPAFSNGSKTQYSIRTKGGKKISATKEEIEQINKVGRKNGTQAANEELRKLKGAEATDEVGVDFKPGRFPKGKLNVEETTVQAEASPRLQAYQRALHMQNERRKAAHPTLSRYLPTSYDIYKSAANTTLPPINPIERIKKAWDPIGQSKGKSTTETTTNVANPTTTAKAKPTGSNAKPKAPVLSKEESREIKDTFKGKSFSGNNDVSDNASSVKGFGDFYRMKNADGTFTIQFELVGGKKFEIKTSQTQLKTETLKMLQKAMKETDRTLPKQQKSKIKLDVIRELKKHGYLKRGGQIDFDLDTTISNFLKNQK